MRRPIFAILCLVALLSLPAFSRETRSMLFGRVLDPQGSAAPGATVVVRNSVAEFKVETNNFDAGMGRSTRAAISMVPKSGANSLHGATTWQHWQQRWQGTPLFVKQNYYRSIAAAEAAGNTARANEIRNTDEQRPGRSHNWGVSAGGPVWIPKVFNGKNKVFWRFTYNALKEIKNEEPRTYNRTAPPPAAREGNFSEMLNLPNSARSIVCDPATVVPEPARATHYIRTPFAGNVIPKSRCVNPAYEAITKLYPLPNNPPAPGQQAWKPAPPRCFHSNVAHPGGASAVRPGCECGKLADSAWTS